MIRNVKDVTDLLDRRFGSAVGRPMSVLRTLVWVIVGIYVLGLLVAAPKVDFQHTHYNNGLQKVPVRDLMLDKNDPRGWKNLKKDPHKFTIAWIGGSTIQIVKPHHHGFLPVDVLHRMPKIDGKPVQVNMYLMEASRIFDLYAATAAAIKSKPDLIVLDLNPLWVFNPNAVQEWTNLNPAALPDLASRPGNWPLLASLYSPSDVALSLADGHLSAIRDRWSFAQRLRSEIDKLSPLTEPVANPTSTTHLSGVKLIATMQESLSFWARYRLIPLDTPGPLRYPAYLEEAKTDGSALNDDIVGQLLGSLGDSKIPSLAYMSAVDPKSLAYPGVDAALQRVEDHLRSIAAAHRSRTLLVQWQSGTRLVHGLQFRDMVHMTYAAPMANELSTTICNQLRAIDPTTECTPNNSRTETP